MKIYNLHNQNPNHLAGVRTVKASTTARFPGARGVSDPSDTLPIDGDGLVIVRWTFADTNVSQVTGVHSGQLIQIAIIADVYM